MNRWLCLSRVWLAVLFIVLPSRKVGALDWVVVPYGISTPSAASRAADRLVSALAERRIVVASQHELRDVFRQRSRPHLALDAQQAKAVADARRRALEHAAYGRRDAARRAAEEAMRAAEGAPEAVLYDTELARHVFDACLAVVRVDLQEHDRELAVTDAQRCRRLVPDLAPRESTHSAEVVGVLAEAENALRRASAGVLTVESSSEACPVFINGRRLGTTPFRYEHAPPGATTVFVECGAARSRVHLLQLGEPEQALVIDPGSEARVADRDVLSLRYASEQELIVHLEKDAQLLAATVGARDIVLVRELVSGRIDATRYQVSRKQAVASLQVDAAGLLGADAAVARQATEVLVLGRLEAGVPPAFQARPEPAVAHVVQTDHAPPVPVAAPAIAVRSESAPRRRRRVWTWAFGAGTVAAGAAVLGLGLTVRDREDQYWHCDPTTTDCEAIKASARPYERATNGMIGVASALGVATLVSFFVEGRKREPASFALALSGQGVLASGSF